MNANLYGVDGSVKGAVELPASVFGVEPNAALLHTVITGYLANQRQGTAKTKGRAEVSGGGKKPWKQKGTGRARAGSNTSPVWVRGGKAHGSNPRDYRQDVTKKMKRKALLCAYSVRAAENSVSVFEGVELSQPKTAVMAGVLGKIGVNAAKTLLIVPMDDKNYYLSSRNIKNVNVVPVNDVSAYDVLNAKNILFVTEELISKVEEVVL